MSSAKNLLIWWNNNFPLDRVFRKKYKIPFNSLQHSETCQIDVLFDILEDRIFEEEYESYKKEQEEIENYKKGDLFKDISSEEELDRFNKFLPEDPKRLTIIDKKDKPINPKGLGYG